MPKPASKPVKIMRKALFYGLFRTMRLNETCGILFALVRVGQRDTRWLTPLTVSGGYQGEEGNHVFTGAADIPRLQRLFLFFSLPYSTLTVNIHPATNVNPLTI
jgi:hypothetical protein